MITMMTFIFHVLYMTIFFYLDFSDVWILIFSETVGVRKQKYISLYIELSTTACQGYLHFLIANKEDIH